MARGRMLNRSISESLKFHALQDDTRRLLATWIVPHLDKRGVFHADALLVKAKVMPLREDITASIITAAIADMERVGLIRLFQAEGRRWMFWPGFLDNQRGLHAEREASDFPEPPKDSGQLPELVQQLPELVQQLPDTFGKSGPEVQVQREGEVEGEREAKPAQAPPRTRKVAGFSAVITESDDPRITAWLTTISPQITAGNVALITERVALEHIDSWHATLKLWAASEWRTNPGAMLERYDTAVNGKRVRALSGANGHAPAGETKAQAAMRILEERAAQREREATA